MMVVTLKKKETRKSPLSLLLFSTSEKKLRGYYRHMMRTNDRFWSSPFCYSRSIFFDLTRRRSTSPAPPTF